MWGKWFRGFLIIITVPQLVANIWFAHESFAAGEYQLMLIQLACFIALGMVSTKSVLIWRDIKKMREKEKVMVKAISEIAMGEGVVITIERMNGNGERQTIATCNQTFTSEGVQNQLDFTANTEALIMAALTNMARALVEGEVTSGPCDCPRCRAKRETNKEVH
ncbi:hypothetical protein [Enterobacter bugandensis]|uniref:hypothetical protein n=1 Tax=Enterobacter bugandensis TaxID=881260 RepID=UPI002006B218|nr:hypothetical protein [Enterobacter bugandensis]MCK7435932.1 hypothetical protein [Enterobacter bugandensis]